MRSCCDLVHYGVSVEDTVYASIRPGPLLLIGSVAGPRALPGAPH